MTGKRFCPECGEESKGNSRFCRSCGTVVGEVTESAAANRSAGRRTNWTMVGAGAGLLAAVLVALLLATGLLSDDDGDPGSSGGTVPLAEIEQGFDDGAEPSGGFFDEPEGDAGTDGSASQQPEVADAPQSATPAFEPSGAPATSDEQVFRSGTHACPGDSTVAVGPFTSCGFANQVVASYRRLPESARNQPFEAFSPTTDESYTMRCSGRNPVKCMGGNDASVYLVDE